MIFLLLGAMAAACVVYMLVCYVNHFHSRLTLFPRVAIVTQGYYISIISEHELAAIRAWVIIVSSLLYREYWYLRVLDNTVHAQ